MKAGKTRRIEYRPIENVIHSIVRRRSPLKVCSRVRKRGRATLTRFTALVTVPFTGRTCSVSLHVKPIRRHVYAKIRRRVYYFRYTRRRREAVVVSIAARSESVREG